MESVKKEAITAKNWLKLKRNQKHQKMYYCGLGRQKNKVKDSENFLEKHVKNVNFSCLYNQSFQWKIMFTVKAEEPRKIISNLTHLVVRITQVAWTCSFLFN